MISVAFHHGKTTTTTTTTATTTKKKPVAATTRRIRRPIHSQSSAAFPVGRAADHFAPLHGLFSFYFPITFNEIVHLAPTRRRVGFL